MKEQCRQTKYFPDDSYRCQYIYLLLQYKFLYDCCLNFFEMNNIRSFYKFSYVKRYDWDDVLILETFKDPLCILFYSLNNRSSF